MTDVVVVMGTRPEVIKLAPVVRALRERTPLSVSVVTTGQHTSMAASALASCSLAADVSLPASTHGASLDALLAHVVTGVGGALGDATVVVVQGDTTSALGGALAGFHAGVPVAHVEAGLRTGDVHNPFPEEMNRRLISRLARWHFAPTSSAVEALSAEGVLAEEVGNTVVDNLLWAAGRGRSAFASSRRRVLVTVHRRETTDDELRGIGSALSTLAARPDVEIVLPVHASPRVRTGLGAMPGVTVVEPLDYLDFTATLASADLVLTDSGGVQEEAPSFGCPVLVLRRTTERPEGIAAGTAQLVGTDAADILVAASRLLDDPAAYRAMAQAVSPYGDGKAAVRIADRLAEDLA